MRISGGCSAYGPRELFSGMHASPSDAVRIFKDVRAQRALGMHWGCVRVLRVSGSGCGADEATYV